MNPSDNVFLLTVWMNSLQRWPFMLFFRELPTLDDVVPRLACHELPYVTAYQVREKAVEMLRQWGLPVFDNRFAASQLVLSDNGDEVGTVEIRKLAVFDNSAKGSTLSRRVFSPLARKLLPLLNTNGIPAPLEEDAWVKVLDASETGPVYATTTPWLGPYHLHVAAYSGDNGNVFVMVRLGDEAGGSDGTYRIFVDTEIRLEPSVRKLAGPWIEMLRQTFNPAKLPTDLGVKKTLTPQGKLVTPDFDRDARYTYWIELDSIGIFGDVAAQVPDSWWPRGTKAVGMLVGARSRAVQLETSESNIHVFEHDVRSRLCRIPLRHVKGKTVDDMVLSFQEHETFTPTAGDLAPE